MSNLPTVSVIVPVYKVEKYLNECVDSILAQTYKNIEIILVDDGSPDRCPQICDEYAAAHPNIHVVHKQNGGLSSARNAGLDVAIGEYVMFVDSDDVILPQMLTDLTAKLNESKADLAVTLIETMETGVVEKSCYTSCKIFSGDEATTALCQEKLRMSACAKLFKRAAIGDVRFRLGVLNEDLEFMFRVYQRCGTVFFEPVSYYRYRSNPTSITKTKLSPLFRDCLDNVDRIAADASTLKPAVAEAARRLRIYRHIHIAVLIRRGGAFDYYADEMRRCLTVVRENRAEIFFSMSVPLKQKIKALAVLLGINIARRQ